MTIELRGVSLRFGTETHIYETDLVLKGGEFNILLGTTLSGKTTLMRLMAGLEKPSTGEVWADGVNVTGVAVQKRSVAMVYQQFVNNQPSNFFITRQALVPPKPKLLDMTVVITESSCRARRMGKPSAAGSSSSILADSARNCSSIINRE